MRVAFRTHDLTLEVPFAISRGVTHVHRICIAEINHGGVTGYGEASPSSYYGDSIDRAVEAIGGSEAIIGDDPFAVEYISRALESRFPLSPSGRAAIEIALYDLVGKISGLPVYKVLGLAGMSAPRTSLTVGVQDVALAEGRLDVLRRFPILKVKLGFGDEAALLRLLKHNTDAILRADVNEAWRVEEAIEKIDAYRREFSVEFFEQPLPKGDIEGYRKLRQKSDATIIVDESIISSADVVEWAPLRNGINIKLMKCGGVREALRMIAVARALGLKVMLGCMVESSVGITAAAHLAPLVDYCDLDGNLLVSNDPFRGMKAHDGTIRLPEEPGLGVRPQDTCRGSQAESS